MCLCCDRAEKLYEEYNQFRAVIKYDGRVHWEPAGTYICVASACQLVGFTNYLYNNNNSSRPK